MKYIFTIGFGAMIAAILDSMIRGSYSWQELSLVAKICGGIGVTSIAIWFVMLVVGWVKNRGK